MSTTPTRVHDADANEETPLLAAPEHAPTADIGVAKATLAQASEDTPGDGVDGSSDDTANDDDRPLPKLAVFWLCLARLAEPLAFFSIFPYVNQMAQQNGNLAEADVGFYSGLIESLFSLTQAVLMLFWGTLSDKVGRKPVLLFSLLGFTVATSIFGLATTLWEMMLYRSLGGVFSGAIVTIRTMLGELSTPKTQAVAFSWFAFSGNLGIFLGPLIGGVLADPVQQYPGAFGGNKFLTTYPYALSSFAVAAIASIGVVTSAIFVKETLHKDKGNNDGTHKAVKPTYTILQLLNAPGVGFVLYVYMHIFFLAFAYTAIAPLFWFTPVALGGFGLNPPQISFLIAIAGIAQAIWLLVLFPILQRRWGTNGVLRACGYAWPVFFALFPLFNLLLKQEDGSGTATKIFWVVGPILMVLGGGVSMAFTAIQLSVNDIAPGADVLGTLNALSLTSASVLRAFTPVLSTSAFALGAGMQWLGGYAIWLVLVVVALGYTIAAMYMPEKEDVEAARRARDAAAGVPEPYVGGEMD